MSVKYRVIERLRNVYPVVALCRILEVSRSGYYDWRYRMQESHADAWLEQQILTCQEQTHFTYGYRRVCKWLRKHTGIHVNRKRVLRAMRKIDALAQIRRRRPYTHYKDAAHRYENLLKRNLIRSAQINFGQQISRIYRRHMACAICAPSLINAAKWCWDGASAQI